MSPALPGALLAFGAAYGTFLLFTAIALGWRGLRIGPGPGDRRRRRQYVSALLMQAGLENARPLELGLLMGALLVGGLLLGSVLFGTTLPSGVIGLFAATAPVAATRQRSHQRRREAHEAWPAMIEEIRLQTVTLGRSVPQALLDVGLRGPDALRGAFEIAHREWLISTDFDRTLRVLKQRLADPTADAVCETVLVAHEIGGTDIASRLDALVEDRVQDLQGRKDAESKQAGARFARRFVLLVPLGMAVAGLSIGNGRAAYGTPLGQAAVTGAIAVIIGCWIWAGRIMRLPAQRRVFVE